MTTHAHDAHSDADLLRQLRGGDAAAFQVLYRRHQGPLYRYAALRCGSADTAADVIQDVFMGLLTGSLHFDPLRGALPNFLFGVARKLLLRHAPQGAPGWTRDEDEDDQDDASPEDACDAHEPLTRLLSDERAEHVRGAIALLPPHYRDAVILYEMHGLSYLEIAEVCQLDIGTVRSRLARGRAALARRLALHAPRPAPSRIHPVKA